MELVPYAEPFERFARVFAEAQQAQPKDPNAVALATAGRDGRPSVRMVLLKGQDHGGFVFYTNLGSRKARELEANPAAALCFYWAGLDTQVRVEGDVEPVTSEEADGYFATRHRTSQIGAWASKQSQALVSRQRLLDRVAEVAAEYGSKDIPRPPHWSGYRLRPVRIEFWKAAEYRLHDRVEYLRHQDGWRRGLLFP